MKLTSTYQTDFKKWLAYEVSFADHQDLYQLYYATLNDQKLGDFECKIEKPYEDEEAFFMITGRDITPLKLNSEKQKYLFLHYFQENYVPTKNIDSWYQQQEYARTKAENHQVLQSASENEPIDVTPDQKEIFYYKVRLFVSSLAALLLLGYLSLSFANSIVSGIVTLLISGIILSFFALASFLSRGYIIGFLKGNAVKISNYQYPEIYHLIQKQAKHLGLIDVPTAYILDGKFNAWVMKFLKHHVLLLHSEAIEAAEGNEQILKFIIGHELAHVRRKHLTQEKYLFPSLIIPFLNKAHARASEYTCDRIGYQFAPQGAVEGILIMSAGKEIYHNINAEYFMNDAAEDHGFWMWFSEKFSSHPHLAKRLQAITMFDQQK